MKNFFKAIFLIATVIVVSCTDKNIVEEPIYPPSAVNNFTATAGNSNVKLNWNRDTKQSITQYKITFSPNDSTIVVSSDSDTYTVKNLTNNTLYTFTIYALNNDQTSEGVTATATPIEPDTTGPQISSFKFLAKINTKMALDISDIVDLTGTIDNDANTITFSSDMVSAYIYVDSLTPTFEVPDGAIVSVDNIKQTSGASYQDFTSSVQYKITLNGYSRVYTVTVNKSHYATIPDAEFVTLLKSLSMPFNDNNQLDITSSLVSDYNPSGKIDLDGENHTSALISNLKGIEFFVSVKEIDVERNNITSLDLRKNKGLRNVVAGLQPLDTLILGDRSDIQIIYLNQTNITTANLQSIISKNIGLTRLYINGTPTVKSIDISKNTSLLKLRLSESTAVASANYITTMLANNSNTVELKIYSEDGKTACTSYDKTTYECK